MLPLLAQLPGDKSTQWLVVVAVGLTIFYALFRRGSKRKDPLETRPGFSLAQQRAVERQMSELLVELSEMARKISAQLDTRATKLELLIDQADQRIAALNGKEPQAPTPNPQPPSAMPARDSRHQEIYVLADAGKTPREIASELGRPHGEIELILALRQRR